MASQLLRQTDDCWPLREGDRLHHIITPGWGEVVHLSDNTIVIWWFTGVRIRFDQEEFFNAGFTRQDGTLFVPDEPVHVVQDACASTSIQSETVLHVAQPTTSSSSQVLSETPDSSAKTHPNKSLKSAQSTTSSGSQMLSETLDSPRETHPNKSRKQYTGTRIELKYIRRNGKSYGPYEYLRFEVGGKSCSRYLGKAKTI